MIKKLLSLIKGKRITLFSTGKAFDSTNQVRTDPIADIIKAQEKKKGGKK